MTPSQIRLLGAVTIVPILVVSWIYLDYENLVYKYGTTMISSIASICGIIVIALGLVISAEIRQLNK